MLTNNSHVTSCRTLLFLLSLAVPCVAHSESVHSEKHDFKIEQLVSGLSSPWSIAFVSVNEWLVTERTGKLRRVVNGQLVKDPVSGLPTINPKGQGGLLDVALDPDFTNNRLVYLSYVKKGDGGYSTEVARGKLVGNSLESTETLFIATPKSGGGRHFGSRLVFDNNGYLYISLGDRGKKNTAQDLSSHNGSIVRVDPDGSIPPSNPYLEDTKAQPEIFSHGHRNVQGMIYDPATSRIWAHEHGPQGGDELNLVEIGKNYGWPVITYGVNYGIGTKIGEGAAKAGMEQPATKWVPSIAPSGMALYNADQFPNWKGNLFVGALKFQLIVRIELDGTRVVHEERLLEGKIGRIRDVRLGPDGLLYLLTDSKKGSIYRLEPND